MVDVFTKALGVSAFMNLINRLGLLNIFSNCIIYPKPFQDIEAVSTSEAALVLRGSVKKHDQKSKSEAVVKKDSKARAKKTKVQKKTISLNDSSIGVLLRKLLVVLKG